jgi:Zn-finger nucleic acid-binding protein
MEMLCPKCHNLMRRYERNGVVVDQCTECGGIFLDKGELEHLVDAETAFNRRMATAPPPPPPPAYDRDPYYDDRRYDDRRYDERYHRRRRRRNFFDELFDFD